MKRLEAIKDRLVGALAGASMGARSMEDAALELELSRDTPIKEGLAEIELALDDQGWNSVDKGAGAKNIDRTTVGKMVRLSRLMYLMNPLIRRAVTVQELYVWGSGCKIKSKSEAVQQVLDTFFEDPANQCVIGPSHTGWAERERDQRNDGNNFFVFFVNKYNGSCRVRLLPFDEIADIICNPEDKSEPWFYKRVYAPENGEIKQVLYPDLNYSPAARPTTVGDLPVLWDYPVCHVKTGGLSGMKFGIPESYSAFNWATGYKGILENFATILKAYARIAMKMTGLGGKKATAAAKSKMGTTISAINQETNPPNNTAAWMMMSGNADISAVKTSGSTTGPDEARALRSMVAAGTDTPEHFFGDSDVGNLATSSTLDRPTELKMVSRQGMWRALILRMCQALIEWSTVAPNGVLRNAGFSYARKKDPFDGRKTVIITPPAKVETKISVRFPAILERSVTERVRATVMAATLGGRKAEGIIPDRKTLCLLLMEALGEEDAAYLVDQLYPTKVVQGFSDPAKDEVNAKIEADAKKTLADAAMVAAKQPKAAAPSTATD